MKSKILLMIMCFVVNSYFSQSLPNSENYVYSRQYLEAVKTTSPSSPSAKQIQNVTYFDGLGRQKQNIAIKSTKSGKDLVVPIEFDDYGRQVKNYLPIPITSLNGNIQPIVGDDVNSYYNTVYGNVTNAYSENVYDESPLNRLKQSAFPGDEWEKSSTHTQDYEYDVNKATENVKKYTATTTWNAAEEIYRSSLDVSGTYGTGELYKYHVTDEDRNNLEVYKNSFGQTILIRKNDGTNIDTYYVYDKYDRLSFTVTPKAAPLDISDPLVLNGLCYQYNYDEWGRLAEKKLPGKGWEFFAYDKYDRLVATQDSKMNAEGKWAFSKYDFQGRVSYTGIATGTSRKSFQSSLNNSTSNEGRNDFLQTIVNGTILYYSNQSFPTTISELLSVNYYDYYPNGTPTISNPLLGQAVLTQDAYNSPISTMSLPTSSYAKNIGEDKWTKNYLWYDTKGRAIASHSTNHLGGFTKTETELDFVGIPKKTITKNSRTSATTPDVTIEENFTYDDQYRLKKHEHEVIGKSPKETLAEYIYNDLGQLIVKKVGGTGTPLQKVSYKYNIRGWLTDINDLDSLNINNEGDLFAYKIRYNSRKGLEYPSTDFSTYKVKPRYNGNIAEVDWISLNYPGEIAPDAANANRYGYVYDGLDRLKAGFYQNPFNPSKGEYNEIVDEYDLNGNIRKLKRFAHKSKSNFPAKIDDLVYDYDGNQVTTINDNLPGVPNPAGYEGGGGKIKYDTNGNMTIMPDKGITAITYNFLNLPNTIEQRGNTTQYTYRADGVKLQRNFTLNNALGSNLTTTEYLDGFNYSEVSNPTLGRALEEQDDVTLSIKTAGEEEIFMDVFGAENRIIPGNPPQIAIGLMFFPTSEGFYDFRKKQYIYQYKDQVGNVRLSYWVHPDEQVLKILDRNDYYPFGMNTIQESEYSVTTSPLNYKFGGKELQESGMYDFGARIYMPDVARWFNVDPVAELSPDLSPYRYAFNNPISFTDPTGMYEDSGIDDSDGREDNSGKGGDRFLHFGWSQDARNNEQGVNGFEKSILVALDIINGNFTISSDIKGGGDGNEGNASMADMGSENLSEMNGNDFNPEEPVSFFGKTDDANFHQVFEQMHTLFKDTKGDGIFRVYGHGNFGELWNGDDEIKDAKTFDKVMGSKNSNWNNVDKMKDPILILFACLSASTTVQNPAIAEKISKAHPNLTVIAFRGFVTYDPKQSGIKNINRSQNSGDGNGLIVFLKNGIPMSGYYYRDFLKKYTNFK